MKRIAPRMLVAVALLAALLPLGAGAAHADHNSMACRASPLRITGEGPLAFLGTIEPVVANPGYDPCQNDEDEVLDLILPGGLGSVEVLRARTTTEMHRSTSRSQVAGLVLTVPGLPEIRADVLGATCTVACRDAQGNPLRGGARVQGESRVVNLSIGGTAIAVPAGHTDIPLGIATLHLNHTETTFTRGPTGSERHITVRALWLEVPGLVDVVAGEARCGYVIRH